MAGVAVPGKLADGVGGGAEAVTPVEPTAVPADSKQFRPRPLSDAPYLKLRCAICKLNKFTVIARSLI